MAEWPMWALFSGCPDAPRWQFHPHDAGFMCACRPSRVHVVPDNFGRSVRVFWNAHDLDWFLMKIPPLFNGFIQCDACGLGVRFYYYEEACDMPKHSYGPNNAERGHHIPERGEIDHFVSGDAQVPGQPTKTPMPTKSVEEVMGMPHHMPVRGAKEGVTKGSGEKYPPATKTPMGSMGKRGS